MVTSRTALYVLLPSTLRASLTLSRHERNHENIALVEPITVSGVYQLAEPTRDGCTCAEVLWGSSGAFSMTLHKVLRALTENELDHLDALDDEARAVWVSSLVDDYAAQAFA